MKFLIVGAGAVGAVYGYHLSQGGGEVGFLVKPKYAQSLREKPLVLYRVGSKEGPVLFKSYSVVERLEELAAGSWDVAVLAVSSTALRDTKWLKLFLKSLPAFTHVVSLGSGLEDRQLILGAGCPLDRFLEGFITFSSWLAPLPNEKTHVVPLPLPWTNTQPPIAYIATGPLTFSGPPAHVDPILRTLKRGGLWAVRLPGRVHDAIFALPAIIEPIILGLEIEDWSFERLAKGRVLPVVTGAMWEGLVLVADQVDLFWVGLLRFLLWTFVLRLVLLAVPLLAPFDVNAFFRYHFLKVGDQTLLYLEDSLAQAQARKLPAHNLRILGHKNPRWKPSSS